MTISKTVVAAFFLVSIMAMPAFADEKHGEKGGMMMGEHGMMGGPGMMMEMKEHHKMAQDMMGMMKEMSHMPTDAQKKRLYEMMMKMDGMMKMHDEMMKKKMEKMEEMKKKKMEEKEKH